MSSYVDSSALLKRYVEEADSVAADALLRADGALLTARHTIVEVRRNLASRLAGRDLAAARTAFAADLRAFSVIALGASCARHRPHGRDRLTGSDGVTRSGRAGLHQVRQRCVRIARRSRDLQDRHPDPDDRVVRLGPRRVRAGRDVSRRSISSGIWPWGMAMLHTVSCQLVARGQARLAAPTTRVSTSSVDRVMSRPRHSASDHSPHFQVSALATRPVSGWSGRTHGSGTPAARSGRHPPPRVPSGPRFDRRPRA